MHPAHGKIYVTGLQGLKGESRVGLQGLSSLALQGTGMGLGSGKRGVAVNRDLILGDHEWFELILMLNDYMIVCLEL